MAWCRSILMAAIVLRAGAAAAGPVVLVSIDGMLPEYYVQADRLGLGIPNLRALVREGAWATGATSVLPSVTFPAHTTMITGVSPRRHGIYTNEIFDPDGSLGGGWHWYYQDVKVPSLFSRARAAGLKTAAVTWPVTAGAPIDLNIPDMYPTPNLREAKNLLTLVRTPGAERVLDGLLPSAEALVHMSDELRARAAVRFLAEKPDLLAVHFLELDGAQHAAGPRTPAAFATLERIDGLLGQIFEALRAQGRWDETTVLVVSDHGFVPIANEVRVGTLLRALGLFTLDGRGRVVSWRAMPWYAGGTVGIVLAPTATDEDRRRVDDAVRLLLGNPAYGVARAFRGAELAARAGFTGAYVVLEARPSFTFSAVLDAPDLVGSRPPGGVHGHDPQRPELRASFLMRGPGVRRNENLGLVRLLDVAPTVARVLGLAMPDVEGHVLGAAFAASAAQPRSVMPARSTAPAR